MRGVSEKLLSKVNRAIDLRLLAAAAAVGREDWHARDRHCDQYDRLRRIQDYLEARCKR